MHSFIADANSSAWSFGSSILTFAFPMLLFIVVAAALYVAYTKPELVPGHRSPAAERPVTYTAVPGTPTAVSDLPRPSAAARGTGQPATPGDSGTAEHGDGE